MTMALRTPPASCRAEITHRAACAWPPPAASASAVARVRTLVADPVHMVGNGLHVVEDVRIEVLAGLPFVAAARNEVIQVLDHAGGRERVAVVVEIQAPGIAGALGEDLENLAGRVIAPDRAVQFLTLGLRRSRLADVGVREDPVRAIEPAVRAPREGVEHLVGVLIAPPVEQHLRRAPRRCLPDRMNRRFAPPRQHAAEPGSIPLTR